MYNKYLHHLINYKRSKHSNKYWHFLLKPFKSRIFGMSYLVEMIGNFDEE